MKVDDQNIMTFEEFLQAENISPTDEKVPLLKKVWNQGVKSSCDYFGEMEGTDHGVKEELTVPTT